MITPPREPFTCVECYETQGINVPLEHVGTTFDNRSVEAKVGYRCPRCNRGVVVSL